MIVTDHFVYIHTSRTGGTFLNRLIMNQVPGARMIQYHGCLRNLPQQFDGLPVIGFVRDPYDWYVSAYYDYRRKRQFVYQVLSNMGQLDFAATVTHFLNLGDGSEESAALLARLAQVAPRTINRQKPSQRDLPGLTGEDFVSFPEGCGYFSWLFRRMYATARQPDIRIGRLENLRAEARRLFAETGTVITPRMDAYLKQAPPMNATRRPRSVGLTSELEALVASRDAELIEEFGYQR